MHQLKCHHYPGSFDEIAAQLGLTRNQVRWRWRRALLALREGMTEYRLESPQLPGLRRDHQRWHVVSGGTFIGTFPTEPQARAARRAFDAAKAA